ncbi:MAG: MerR family transcriptional regulator [Clostridia bacterium]|nr:MerR family transcriptional regulator [Clostridia bacterium]
MDNKLYDINEVCRLLDTTSRTLRFYEEKGIISSTKVPFNSRRHYSEEQVDHIRNIMVLRALGLPIKFLLEYRTENRDVKDIILERKAEIYALLEKKNKELIMLVEALEKIESGGDIFNIDKTMQNMSAHYSELVESCTKLFVEGKIKELYKFFSKKMEAYRPISSFEIIRDDVLKPIGSFVSYGKIEIDKVCDNIYYQKLYYEKMGLEVKYIFINDKIGGFWLNYFELR